MSIILGIDPGSRVTGYGLIECSGNTIGYVASGVIRLQQTDMVARLDQLYTSLGELLVMHSPTEAAVEKVFVGKSADSALKLGQARGVAMLALARADLAIAEYAPRAIKQAVTGSGAADKRQVCDMVMRNLSLSGMPSSDASDALAIALCHAYSANFQRVLQGRRKPLTV